MLRIQSSAGISLMNRAQDTLSYHTNHCLLRLWILLQFNLQTESFCNKLFLTKLYLENCFYRKPRDKVNCSLREALRLIITVENTGGRR